MIKQTQCPSEQIVVKSIKSGFINDEIAAHIQSCNDCRETVKIVQFFQTNTVSDLPPKNLPSAGLVWWKSRLRNRQKAAEQVAKPIYIVQCIGSVIALVTFLWLMTRDSTGFSSLDSGLSRVLSSMEQVVFPLAIGLIFLTFICITLIFTLRRFLVER
jgi:hypothetical protein